MKVITTKNSNEKNRSLEKRKEGVTVRNLNPVNVKNTKTKKGRRERRGREKGGERRKKAKKIPKKAVNRAAGKECGRSIVASATVPPPTQIQLAHFLIPQGDLYYHQFLIQPRTQMPSPTLIPPIWNVQSKEAMEVPGQSMAAAVPQRPASAGNPKYISLLKRDTVMGQPGCNHSGQRDDPWSLWTNYHPLLLK
uniref:Uncharacterized protein n=1 Tax=Romanomermis culicivorax TaxID=13658 RepID=A0A915L596_ROMCU